MMRSTITAILAAAALLAASRARAQDPVSNAAAAVAESTSTPRLRIEDLYKGDRYPDPFAKMAPGEVVAAGGGKEFSLETFTIHSLKLKGILREKAGTYAMLTDMDTGTGFMLRKGRLYTYKNEKIPGVTGRINAAQKTVVLMTAEKDVQTLRLGEAEDEAAREDIEGEE